MSRRRFTLCLSAVGAIALAVRIAYVLIVGRHIPLAGDAATYQLLANNLSDGLGYIRPYEYFSGEVIPTAEFPPLFPAILSLAVSAGATATLTLKLFMTMFGTATVIVIGLIGRTVGGSAVGLVAASIAAVYPMLFEPDAALMPETLAALFAAIGTLIALRALQDSSRRLWLFTGLALGAGALVRAEIALLAPLFVLPLILRRAPWRQKLVRTSVLFVGLAALVLPWTVRNAVRLDHFVPVSNNFGGLILGSNCPPTYEGRFTGLWLFKCYDRVDATGLDETERSHAYLREGLSFARERPERAAVVSGIRVLRVWGVYDVDGQLDWESFEGRNRRWHMVGHRMYLGLAIFAIGGIVTLLRRRQQIWPLLASLLLITFMAVVSYGNQRFRATAEPAIVVLAAAGIGELVRLLKSRVRWVGASL